MYFYYLATFLIALAASFSYLNYKYLYWPAPIGVMTISLTAAVLSITLRNFFPQFVFLLQEAVSSINFYEVFMKVFLGFILFAGAFRISIDSLKKEIKPVLVLALFSTLLSTFLIGFALFFLQKQLNAGIPLVQCLLFGSILSPTDPVAVLGIFKKTDIPASIAMKIKGESLFNDGIAIVLFTALFSMAANQEEFSASVIGALFVKETLGGLALGAVLALVGYYVFRSIDNYKVEILISLVIVMAGYSIADNLGVSAPIAIVIAGLITGSKTKTTVMSEETRRFVSSFWELLDDFLNLVLFLLIGLEFLVIEIDYSIALVSLGCILIMLTARFIAVGVPVTIFRSWFEKNAAIVLTWCGLRGSVSLALALFIPTEMNRHYFVVITYIIAVFSIIVQGLTIKKLISRLDFG